MLKHVTHQEFPFVLTVEKLFVFRQRDLRSFESDGLNKFRHGENLVDGIGIMIVLSRGMLRAKKPKSYSEII